MTFAHPGWLVGLWLAAAVLVLVLYAHRRRSRILSGYARALDRVRLITNTTPRRRRLDGILLALAVALLVLALAGPRYGYRWRTSERRGVDLIVALDCSRSMLAADVEPTRLDRAKREVLDLLRRLEGDRIGLVAFAGTAFLQCPLTLDYSGLHIFLRALSPDFLPVGGTALGEAIRVALDGFDEHSAADRAILVLTDGEETEGQAAAAMADANGRGVAVYVVGVGTPEGAPVPAADGGFVRDPEGKIVMARLNETQLSEWAVDSGGAYVRSVAGDEDRDALYRRMHADLELKTLASRKVKVWEERFQWPLAFAALAVLVVLAGPAYAPLRRRGRLLAVLLVSGTVVAAGTHPAGAAGARTWVRDGLERYRSEEYDEAAQAFLRAQVEAPRAPEVAYDLGSAQYKNGDFEAAYRSFSAALEDASPDLAVRSRYNRGNAAFRLGRLEEATRDYRAVLDADPGHEDARLNLAYAEQMLQQQQQQSGAGRGSSSESREDQPAKGQEQPQPSPTEEKSPGNRDSAQGEQGTAKGGGEETSRQDAGQPEQRPESDSRDVERSEADRGKSDPDAAATPGASGPAEDGAESSPGTQEIERQRARAMLNRLTDQPGKALMPRYAPRSVEKDW